MDKSQYHCAECKILHMIPFLYNPRKIQSILKQISGCLVLGAKGKQTTKGHKESLGDNENVLYADCGVLGVFGFFFFFLTTTP